MAASRINRAAVRWTLGANDSRAGPLTLPAQLKKRDPIGRRKCLDDIAGECHGSLNGLPARAASLTDEQRRSRVRPGGGVDPPDPSEFPFQVRRRYPRMPGLSQSAP